MTKSGRTVAPSSQFNEDGKGNAWGFYVKTHLFPIHCGHPSTSAGHELQIGLTNAIIFLIMDTPKETAQRPPFPPFTHETAVEKVRMAENGWNSREPEKVALAYTIDSWWRNRAEFIQGRPAIIAFLTRKWKKELDYRLIKELWACTGSRIAVRFAYEWHDDSDQWFRSYGNENWDFDSNGLMHHRHACINDLPIKESERKFRWDSSKPRPADHPGLTSLGL